MHAIHCTAHLHAAKRLEIMKATQVDARCMRAIHYVAHLHTQKLLEIKKATQVDTHDACMQFIALLACMHQSV